MLFFLPDFPETVSWLSVEERALALRRLHVELSKGLHQSDWWHDTKATLLDWRLWGHYAVYFGISTPFSSLSLFTPSITAGLGYKDLRTQLMSVPPYAVAYVVQILVSWPADGFNQRHPLGRECRSWRVRIHSLGSSMSRCVFSSVWVSDSRSRRGVRLHTSAVGVAVFEHIQHRIRWPCDCSEHWTWGRTRPDRGRVDLQG